MNWIMASVHNAQVIQNINDQLNERIPTTLQSFSKQEEEIIDKFNTVPEQYIVKNE